MATFLLSIALVLKITFWFLIAWIIVHAMALFGFFAAVGFPVLSLFDVGSGIFRRLNNRLFYSLVGPPPGATLYSDVSGTKRESHDPRMPFLKLFFVNSGALILITLLSIVIVFFEAKVVLGVSSLARGEAVFVLNPSRGEYQIGEPFYVRAALETNGFAVRSARADLRFPADILEVVDISTENSFARFFVEKKFDNAAGVVKVAGGAGDPGYKKTRGVLATVTFRAKRPGLATVDFLDSSNILAAEGLAANILKEKGSAQFSIKGSEASALNLTLTEENLPAEEILGVEAKEKMTPANILRKIDEKILRFWLKLLFR